MENIVCPYCNGSGCPNCRQSGQLQVSPQELQQLQALMTSPTPTGFYPPTSQPQTSYNPDKTLPGSRITLSEIKTKFSGFVALLVIIGLGVGAYLSYKTFRNFYPYLACLLTLLVVGGVLAIGRSAFWQHQEPSDFVQEVAKLKLQKSGQAL
jgi:hypothetical protein